MITSCSGRQNVKDFECIFGPVTCSGCILGPGCRPGGGMHSHVVGLHLSCAAVLRGGRQAGGAEVRPLPVLLHVAVLHHTGCGGCSQPGYRGAQTRAGEVNAFNLHIWITHHSTAPQRANNTAGIFLGKLKVVLQNKLKTDPWEKHISSLFLLWITPELK